MPRKSRTGKQVYLARSNRARPMRQGMELSPAATIYRGPVVPMTSTQLELITQRLTYVSGVTSNNAGLTNQFFTSAPSQAVSWSALSALYQEFRVLGMRLTYVPNNLNYQGTTTSALTANGYLIFSPFRSSSYVQPANGGGAFDQSQSMARSPQERVALALRMGAQNEAQFLPVSQATQYFFGVNLTGNFPSAPGSAVQIGNVFVDLLVQFRGRA